MDQIKPWIHECEFNIEAQVRDKEDAVDEIARKYFGEFRSVEQLRQVFGSGLPPTNLTHHHPFGMRARDEELLQVDRKSVV